MDAQDGGHTGVLFVRIHRRRRDLTRFVGSYDFDEFLARHGVEGGPAHDLDQPRLGAALVFFPCTLDGQLDPLALHAGEPAGDTKCVRVGWGARETVTWGWTCVDSIPDSPPPLLCVRWVAQVWVRQHPWC